MPPRPLSGWEDAYSSLRRLNLTGADTDLVGNGASPEQLLGQDGDAFLTCPDRTENSLSMANLEVGRPLARDLSLDSNGCFRRSNSDTLNGDDFEEFEGPANARPLCEAEDLGTGRSCATIAAITSAGLGTA